MTSANMKNNIGVHWMLCGPMVDEHLKPGGAMVERFFVD